MKVKRQLETEHSQTLAAIVRSLDDRILSNPELGPDFFAQLTASQRELGLLHGDRPTCPFLRPHLVTRSQYTEITRAAELIAVAFEKLVQQALTDHNLFGAFGLTQAEATMARIDPGYANLCVTSRLDAYMTDSGFQFLEYNAESPAGVGDQMQLEKVLFPLRHIEEFLTLYKHWRPQPQRQLLKALLAAYRAWGGEEERPQIAIVDWRGVPTESEFRILRNYFEAEGHKTVIADPNELHYDGEKLRTDDLRIDIVYKRVLIHEFLARFDEHPLIRAYADKRICMANSFRSKLAHKKVGFALLTDPAYQNLFSTEEIELIRRHIPWTRYVQPGRTIFEGVEWDLLQLIRHERERFVLKPNDDYGGHGVVLGWESNEAEWNRAIQIALAQPYVVQQRAACQKVSMPMFTDHVSLEELFIDFNPFLFNNKAEGALVRLSSSSLLNVTSGGGETALLVLEGI
jgi:glutathionylspermidine synthase